MRRHCRESVLYSSWRENILRPSTNGESSSSNPHGTKLPLETFFLHRKIRRSLVNNIQCMRSKGLLITIDDKSHTNNNGWTPVKSNYFSGVANGNRMLPIQRILREVPLSASLIRQRIHQAKSVRDTHCSLSDIEPDFTKIRLLWNILL